MKAFGHSCCYIVLLLLPVVSMGQGAYLGDLSWVQAEQRFATSPVVILPFGAGAKEHGPHMPMNADSIVMEYLVDAAVNSRNVIAAPPILHGWERKSITYWPPAPTLSTLM